MPQAWRLVPERRVASAFTGEGARINGGRWNSKGLPVVYTSAHKSLAALELLVHYKGVDPLPYVAFHVEWKDGLAIDEIEHVPEDWRMEPPPSSTMQIGDAWLRNGRCAFLAAPSVIIPEEYNYLINPRHPDFQQVRISGPVAFTFDSRLL